MKCKHILSIIALGAGLALCPGLHAQDTSGSTPATSGTGGWGGRGGGGAGGGRGMNADMMLQRLTTALTLTTDEQTQIKPILETEVTQMQSIRADTSLAPADRRSKMTDARTTANTAINAILTPDQQTKYAAMQQRMRTRGGGGGGGGGNGGGGNAPATTGS